jgi:hypothetical protein
MMSMLQESIDGLIVLQPYANQIITKAKKFEYRKSKPPANKVKVPLLLLSKGFAIGKIMIMSYGHGWGELGTDYRWQINVIEKFSIPIKYNHTGQQVWVKNVELLR